jgi:hypothetical protein
MLYHLGRHTPRKFVRSEQMITIVIAAGWLGY